MVTYFAYAQVSLKWREWSFRIVSQRQAETLVACGEAMPITRLVDGEVRVVGYRALKPTSWERPSVASLTFSTLEAVGREALGGHMARWARDEVFKYRVWPLIGDDKAVAVRPRMTEAERRFAEKLLANGGRRVQGAA
jgi:hypothetical protein